MFVGSGDESSVKIQAGNDLMKIIFVFWSFHCVSELTLRWGFVYHRNTQ